MKKIKKLFTVQLALLTNKGDIVSDYYDDVLSVEENHNFIVIKASESHTYSIPVNRIFYMEIYTKNELQSTSF